MKQIAFNLYNGLCGTLHARSGVHCPYNLMECPLRFRQTAFMIIEDGKADTSECG